MTRSEVVRLVGSLTVAAFGGAAAAFLWPLWRDSKPQPFPEPLHLLDDAVR